MRHTQIRLNHQEKAWILARQTKRLTDDHEVLIYPMGAERYLGDVLHHKPERRYPIKADIMQKNVLVIPGHGTSGFIFAAHQAKSVTIVDKDPLTLAYMKGLKQYYHYREYSKKGRPYPSIGELSCALSLWYPPLLPLNPLGRRGVSGWGLFLKWLLQPNELRRIYLYHQLDLLRKAILTDEPECYELNHPIDFYSGTLSEFMHQTTTSFDTAFVPYLLGVEQGIESPEQVLSFIHQLFELVPQGHILITPSRSTREFYIAGKNYLETWPYRNIQDMPQIKQFLAVEDRTWFKTQGLIVLKRLP